MSKQADNADSKWSNPDSVLAGLAPLTEDELKADLDEAEVEATRDGNQEMLAEIRRARADPDFARQLMSGQTG